MCTTEWKGNSPLKMSMVMHNNAGRNIYYDITETIAAHCNSVMPRVARDNCGP